MNCDCAFYIGSTHEVCQDYALAGGSTVTIADGCSGSVLSDVGSRILSIVAMNKMIEIDSLQMFDEKEIILLARPSIKMLNIPTECLDTTLFSAVFHGQSSEIIGYGDGVIAICLKNKSILVIDIEYYDNCPFYVNYIYDNTNRLSLWEQNHNKRRINLYKIDKEKTILINEINSTRRIEYDDIEIGVIKMFEHKIIVEIINIDQVESINLMSDGIHSFYETITEDNTKTNKSIPFCLVLSDLLSYKNYVGKFVQRRMNRFLQDCQKKDWYHSDDISLASIYVGTL